MNPEKLMVGKNCQIQQLIQNNTFIMKFLYILLIYFSPYILIASQSMVSLLEESFYNETEGYVSKENVHERIEHLQKTGVLGRFSSIYATQKSKTTPLLVITKLGSIESPNISNYIVNEEEIIGIRVFYNYESNAIDYKITIHSISKSEMEEILNKISKLKHIFCNRPKHKYTINNNDPIIIFRFKGGEKSIVSILKVLFLHNTYGDSLMSLRKIVLSLLGLDEVEADLSNITERSLRENLRKKSVTHYNINDSLCYFLENKKIYGLSQSIWQYFASSDSLVDKYIAIWIFYIEMKFRLDSELPVECLFKQEYISFLQQLDPNENIFYTFIYYKYYVFKNNDRLAEMYLKKLEKTGIDKKLLQN